MATDDTPQLQPVSEEGLETFEALGLKAFDNLALGSTWIAGVACDAIVAFTDEPNGDVGLYPIAVLVNEKLFPLLTPPDTGLEDK